MKERRKRTAATATMSTCARSSFHEGRIVELSKRMISTSTMQPAAIIVLATTERRALVLLPPAARVTLISESSMASARSLAEDGDE